MDLLLGFGRVFVSQSKSFFLSTLPFLEVCVFAKRQKRTRKKGAKDVAIGGDLRAVSALSPEYPLPVIGGQVCLWRRVECV